MEFLTKNQKRLLMTGDGKLESNWDGGFISAEGKDVIVIGVRCHTSDDAICNTGILLHVVPYILGGKRVVQCGNYPSNVVTEQHVQYVVRANMPSSRSTALRYSRFVLNATHMTLSEVCEILVGASASKHSTTIDIFFFWLRCPFLLFFLCAWFGVL